MLVVKIGGGEGNQIEGVCRDIAELHQQGRQTILIHGGSHLTNELAEKLGYPPKFITSPSGFTSRYTDRRTMEIFQMAYCGQTNKAIVEQLQKLGVNAVGLSGMDGKIWSGPRKKAVRAVEDGKTKVVRDNLTGIVENVNSSFLLSLLEQGLLPVITPPAISVEGEPINVDGDRAAAATAVALSADDLVILSNVAGLYRDFSDKDSLIENLLLDDLDQAIESYAEGRMRIKLHAAKEALGRGVGQVVIGDSRLENCLQKALQGVGTTIKTGIHAESSNHANET